MRQNEEMDDSPDAMQPRRRRWKRWVVVGMIVVASVIWMMRGESEAMRKSRSVQLGMTVAEALQVMEVPTGLPAGVVGPVTVGFGGPFSMRTFGWLIERATGWRSPLSNRPDEVEINFDADGRVCRIKRGDEFVVAPEK